MSENHWDALVVGAGAGGLCAAARLSHHGYRTLVVECLDRVGGRASTEDVYGFKINTGAIGVELGGITEQTFTEVGAKFEVRPANPPILYRIGGRTVDIATGGWQLLISQLIRQGAPLIQDTAERGGGMPDRELCTADWVRGHTKNAAVHGIFRAMCGTVFAAAPEELPARVFLTHFSSTAAFDNFGFCPEGTIGLWKALAEVVERNGGQVLLSTQALRLHVEDGRITGATLRQGGESREITCDFAVSDIGPSATLDLVGPEHFPSEYIGTVLQGDLPSAMISVNFTSRDKLLDAPGLLSFVNTRRLCYAADFTATCPEMAPEGWHLYVGTGVPKPSVGDFDVEAEAALVLQDLRHEIDGFDQARLLSIAVTRDDWPTQRTVAGYDMPHDTPIPNLWNVGDAVKEYAHGGTTACAETAKIVVDKILLSAASRPSPVVDPP
ncbi:phytoene desaturase family protein [Nocardia sp. NPDC056000]|uniref:phytoene desaturase family protein n=1 Tax=Nocardia sp. NPDC056000 TaxID=3345674 RepID=UPI0035DADA17